MEEVLRRNALMVDKQSAQVGLSFQPQPSDIFITTYPKCGTTWVSFICHTLRTRGAHLDFEEIVEVCPWTVFAHDVGIDMNAPQVAQPRIFKSHEDFAKVPKGGKYIYVFRHPIDVCLSFYPFLVQFVGLNTADVSIDDFVDKLFLGAGSASGKIWNHYLSFYEHRHESNILFLFYEDLKEHLEESIERIAVFMGIELDDELRSIALLHSSFEFMKTRSRQFDEHIVFNACKRRMGLSGDAVSKAEKVYKGQSRDITLSAEQQERLQTRWESEFGERTGIMSYHQLWESLSIFAHKGNN